MTGTGRDTIVPPTHTDIAAMVSAIHGVGATYTAEADGITDILDTMDSATEVTSMAITSDIGTDTMTEFTLVTTTTTSTVTDPSLTDTSTAMVLTTEKPKTVTTTEETVPTWQVATAAWAAATTVHTPTTMAAG